VTRRRVIRTAPSPSPIPDRRTAQSLADQATQLLREEILGGRFGFGTRLNEMRLADDFSLSRGPIREALRGLEREGLIVALPNRGSYVSRVSLDYFAEILDFRQLVEPVAFERSVKRRSHALAGGLLAALAGMRAAQERGDWGQLSERHARFHGTLFTEAGGRVLPEVWNRIEVPLRIYVRGLDWDAASIAEMIDSHEVLAEQLIGADLSEGRAAILRHLDEASAKLPFPFGGTEPDGTNGTPSAPPLRP